MQPTMNMDTSSKTLNTQASLKSKEIEEIIFKDYHYKDKTWSKSPTAPYTATVAEGIIVSIMECSHLYWCNKVETYSFLVTFQGNAASTGDVCTKLLTKQTSCQLQLYHSQECTLYTLTNMELCFVIVTLLRVQDIFAFIWYVL